MTSTAILSSQITIAQTKRVSLGNRIMVIGTMTIAPAGDAVLYVDEGIALPTTWKGTLQLQTVDLVDFVSPLVIAASPEVALLASVDLTNEKVLIYGGATTAAEDVPLEDLPATASIAAGSYIATFFAIGY